MTVSDSALTVRAATDSEVQRTFDDRHWRVRGVDKQLSGERLRVNLLVARQDRTHVDTLDLYVARQRRMFLREAAEELYVEEDVLKRDLGRLLRELESYQDQLLRQMRAPQEPEVPVMTDAQQHEARELLRDPRLIERILADYQAGGLVGEETNKLACYLTCTSRLLPRPLAVLVQSSSAAGKTSLLEATLALMPPEAVHRMSSLTGQALYYMGTCALQHKILAVAEEAGVAEAAYALKLLQSDGRLRIATVGKDSGTGRPVTQHYEVEGPVAMLLTTTAERPDEELANRCLTLSVCEQPEQTATIHDRQRAAYLPAPEDGAESGERDRIRSRHQHAQRLLEPREVVIPYADRLTFRTDQVRYRREHAQYLSLIATVALLHQYQRQQVLREGKPCVVATLADLRVANRLAAAVLGVGRDELLPQAKLLLEQWDALVTRYALEQHRARQAVWLTQRQLRETLGWNDRALRRQLSRLIELEYVLAKRTGRGNQRTYQLLYEHARRDEAVWPLGLAYLEGPRIGAASPPHAARPCDPLDA